MWQRGKGGWLWGILATAALAVMLLRATAGGLPAWAAPVSGLGQEVLAPLEALASRATSALRDAAGFARHLTGLERENADLRRRAERVDLLEAQVEELKQENRRLRALLDLRSRTPWLEGAEVLAGRVVARNPDDWFATAVVGKGSADGVRPGMAALTASGLAGRVTRVTSGSATVMLLTDPQSGVGAMVQRESSRAQGVVLGQAGRGDVLLMRFFSRDADVRRGDRVVTSDRSMSFPAALPVGAVAEVFNDPEGLVRYAWVKPAVDFNRVEEVLLAALPAEPGGAGRGVSP